MLDTIEEDLVQGDNEEFADFLSRCKDSACEHGQPLPITTAEPESLTQGILMMHPLGHLELHADPSVPAVQVPQEDLMRIHRAHRLARIIDTAVMLHCSNNPAVRVKITPSMTREEAETTYWDALHAPDFVA